jgi:hypothetical protein
MTKLDEWVKKNSKWIMSNRPSPLENRTIPFSFIDKLKYRRIK